MSKATVIKWQNQGQLKNNSEEVSVNFLLIHLSLSNKPDHSKGM